MQLLSEKYYLSIFEAPLFREFRLQRFLTLALSLLLGMNVFAGNNANKGLTVSLFSEVKGVVKYQGEPVADAVVTRKYHFTWVNKDIEETTQTNERGEFSFKEATTWMILGKFFPHEPVIPQIISVHFQGEELDIWQHTKRTYDSMGELYPLEAYSDVSTPVMDAYREGYILIDSELSLPDLIMQASGDHAFVFARGDLRLPYQVALERIEGIRQSRSSEFLAALIPYFTNSERWRKQFDEPEFRPYQGAMFQAIEALRLSDYSRLYQFEEEYKSDELTVATGGEVILRVRLPNGEEVKIRGWLSDGVFKVSDKQILVDQNRTSLVFNQFNIDPDSSTD
ncbi:DUF6795 domain-containing protein [Litoribacillus peritrichatus]|uniref:DUF6795 domain-containing protein n=1 Tax=Litoribacillus peritrichatus TaxID=718191 RepID=A0ABP7N2H1_9GAMM